jgi:hypothetical protein
MVYSTPAGKRRRPRIRRGHEQKTRGGVRSIPTVVSYYETAFQIMVTAWKLACFPVVTLAT